MLSRNKIFGLSWPVIITIIFSGLIIGIIAGFIFGFRIPDEPPEPKVATIIYDCHGEEITRLFQENRIEISFDRIPLALKNAVISVEDTEFYKHKGINFKAIIRALWVDLMHQSWKEGASTITQQLAKNALLTQKKTISRKIKEALIAINMERTLTKDEILERYLNYIIFGHGKYGVEAASLFYFNKHVWDLELHQVALLAGVLRSPENYSPYKNPERAIARRSLVLNKMVEHNYLTREEAEEAKKKPLDTFPLQTNRREAPYFVDYVVQELINKHGFDEETLYTLGYRIYTTLDLKMQKAAMQALTDLPTAEPDERNVTQPQAAIVALDPTNGQIKAMVGGRDYVNTQLNRATMAYRQPGSAIKPFVYTAAIDSGNYTPATIFVDEPVKYPDGYDDDGVEKFWTPTNYDKTYRGPLRLREAFEDSINTIAVKLVEELGPSRVVQTAKKMGVTSLLTSGKINDLGYSSLALGGLTKGVSPLELATAYTPLANRGIRSEPIAILKVMNDENHVIIENIPSREVALRETTAYMMTDLLKGVVERGTGRRANIGRPAAGKTGTTSEYTNGWFVGYTPELLATVWIGNDSQVKPLVFGDRTIGSGTAAEIWGKFMRQALEGKPITDFTPPSGMSFGVEICAQTGLASTPFCPEVLHETFISGTEPTERCNIHWEIGAGSLLRLEICLDTGLLATPDCPRERVVSKTYEATTGLEINEHTPLPTETCYLHGKEEEVIVSICSESGLLATSFCPKESVINMSFKKGEEPTIYCDQHLPSRYRGR